MRLSGKNMCIGFCGSGFPAAIVLFRGWKAAPTGVFFSSLGSPEKQIELFRWVIGSVFGCQFLGFLFVWNLVRRENRP